MSKINSIPILDLVDEIVYIPEDYSRYIGKKVIPLNGKTFKSTLGVNTINSVATDLTTRKIVFTFLEDDSIVDADDCLIIGPKDK